jgi:exportin-5
VAWLSWRVADTADSRPGVPTLRLSLQAVRSDGPALWRSLCPELLAGAAAPGGGHAEMACLVLHTLGEDVTVYNDDLDGGHMRSLLSGLTSTLGETLPCLYRVLQAHVPVATGAGGPGDAQGGAAPGSARAASVAATHAALAAAASHAEWVPIASLARSGVLAAACALLTVPMFRLPAAAVLKAAVSRRITDVEDDKAVCHDTMDGCGDALASATASVSSVTPDDDSLEFAVRLTDALQTHAAMHLPRAPHNRARLLAGLLAMTRHPSLRVCAPAWVAWQALLRQAGAPVSGAMGAPPPAGSEQQSATPAATAAAAAAAGGGGDGAKALELPDGMLPALAEATGERLCSGGGLAGSCDSPPPGLAASWEADFDSPEEMRDTWLQVRSHAMTVARMCCALDPATVLALAQHKLQTAAAVAASPAGEAGCITPGVASGALEGAIAFFEAAVAGAADNALQPSGPAAPAAEACLSTLLAIPRGRAPGVVLQQSRGLEACARVVATRQEAATAVLAALFSLLDGLPGGGGSSPDSAVVAVVPRGIRDASTVARQRVCTSVLGVAATAGSALRPHLARLADTLGALQLRGTERGTLAEALLTVAQSGGSAGAAGSDGPSGPDVLGWLLAPVAARWEGAPPAAALQPATLASALCWPLFDDVQLLERCLRRVLLSATSCADPATREPLLRALTAHASWALPHILRCCSAVHSLWTPTGRDAMARAGLAAALEMSPEEVALYTGARDGPSGASGSVGGGTGWTPPKTGPPPLAPPNSPVSVVPTSPAALAAAAAVDADAVRGFLRGVRDACYGLIALALPGLPSSGPPGAPAALPAGELYGGGGVPDAMGASLLGDVAAMELRHVRQLTKTVIQPLLCRTPPALRSHWFASLLPRLLPHMRDVLTAKWAAHVPLVPGDPAAASEQAQAEVVHDRVLRDATRAHTTFLAALVTSMEHSSPAWASLPEEASSLTAGAATAAASLTWPDGEAACKGAAVCRSLAAAAADHACPALPPSAPAWGHVLSAALSGLTLASNGPYAVELLNLVRDLLMRVSTAAVTGAPAPSGPGAAGGGAQHAAGPTAFAPALRAVISQLPGVGDAGADALGGDLQRGRSDREQRATLKVFLQRAAGGVLPALAVAEGSSRTPASAVTVTRLGAPAERRSRGSTPGFGAAPDAQGAVGLAALGDS